MSLLLEALKKAEKAKDEAQRQAGAGSGSESGLQLEAAPAPAVEPRHITTRDELPSIAQSMDITSADLGGTSGATGQAEHRSARAAASRSSAYEAPPAERAAAKKVFEAKFREPNPKLPFYIVMGMLAAFGIGTVAYFWYQLRPPPPLVNANPPRTAPEAPAAAAAGPAAELAQAKPAPAPQVEIRGLPAGAPAAAAPPSATAPAPAAPTFAKPAVPAPAAPTSAKPAAPTTQAPATARQQGTPVGESRQPRAPVAVRRVAPSVDPQVDAGFGAYQAGDLAASRSAYARALAGEPTNRDALLGLAAVEIRSQNPAAAEELYLRLLRADPRDPHAQAGLLALRGQSSDPVAAESRIKTLLAGDPESGALNFALANQYSQQGRWAEAQQAYFKAHAADPDSPDIAHNLAVSLDHLRQPKLALEYYRRALALAERRAAGFDRDALLARVQQLSR